MSTIVTGADYLSLPRSASTWIVQDILPVGGSMMLYGDPKVGKSFAALHLAMAIQRGEDWLGFPIAQGGDVVYIQLDTPRSLWAARLESLSRGGWPVDHLRLADRETLGTWPFDILNPDHADLVSRSLSLLSPSVVIIDTIREAHNADENDSTTMKQVLSSLVRATQPASLVLISHPKKPLPESSSNVIMDLRGSSYIVGAMDTIVKFGHKSMQVAGRAIEEQSIPLRRLDDGMWERLG